MSDQWAGIETLLEHGWPGSFDDAARAAYRILLDGFDPEQILVALRVLVRKGGAFRPSAAEVAAAVVADPTKPTWPEALRDLRKALRVRTGYFDSLAEKEATCVGWLREHSHELVAAFFEAQTYERLSMLPIEPGAGEGGKDYSGVELERLRQAWEQFTERAEERQAHGLPIGTGPSRRQIGPRKPDFAGALPTGGAK